MTDHFFSTGEHVIYSERTLSGAICLGEYEITGLLGGYGEKPQYQLTCADQSHHRVVGEHEIRYMTAAEVMKPPALLELKQVHPAKKSKPMLTDPALLSL